MPVKATTERHGAQRTIARTLDSLEGVRYEKRHGNAYEGAGKADFTGAVQCKASVREIVPAYDEAEQRPRSLLIERTITFAWRFEIEAKRAGEQGRKLQEYRLRQWADTGALTGIASTRDDVLAILAPALALRGG